MLSRDSSIRCRAGLLPNLRIQFRVAGASPSIYLDYVSAAQETRNAVHVHFIIALCNATCYKAIH